MTEEMYNLCNIYKVSYQDIKQECKSLLYALRYLEQSEKMPIITKDNFDELFNSEETIYPLRRVLYQAYKLAEKYDTGIPLIIRQYFQEKGYKIYAGEQDSFGWLSGVIKTKKGEIMFG
jgi:hypothetical protein